METKAESTSVMHSELAKKQNVMNNPITNTQSKEAMRSNTPGLNVRIIALMGVVVNRPVFIWQSRHKSSYNKNWSWLFASTYRLNPI